MAILFFSYSHRDEQMRDELEIHLAMLKRQRVIETWHDRRIQPGDEFNRSISRHLEEAHIILLLISPYFIASDYCYDIEMSRAMERHESGEARVIPVILQPCDWHSAPFGKLLATPQDGKPVAKYPNVHDAFLEISRAIREAAQASAPPAVVAQASSGSPASVSAKQVDAPQLPRSSNLRLKRIFTEHDRDTFLEETFEYLAKFFEGSLTELQKRNSGIEGGFRRVDANTFTATIYRSGSSKAKCTVRLGGSFGGLTYSEGDNRLGDSFNESLSVENDGTVMSLRAMMGGHLGQNRNSILTQEGAAEYFWEKLLWPLQNT